MKYFFFKRLLLPLLLLATLGNCPAYAQDLGGAGTDNGFSIPAGSNTIVVSDGSGSAFTTIATALTAIAADDFGWGVPDGTSAGLVWVRDERNLTTEHIDLPKGVRLYSPKGTLIGVDLSGATPGIIMAPGSAFIGYTWVITAGGGSAPFVKVDHASASGTELPTEISNNHAGLSLSSIAKGITLECSASCGSAASNTVKINDITVTAAASTADIEATATWVGTIQIKNSVLYDVTGVAGSTGYGVGSWGTKYDDVIWNSPISNSIFSGGSASTFTLGAVAHATNELAMMIGALTDNGTGGAITNTFATSISNNGPAATTTASGVVELATLAESQTGSDATRALTPSTVTDFTGATAGVTGERGTVPKPLAGEQEHILTADGTWRLHHIFLSIATRDKNCNGLAWKDIGQVPWDDSDFAPYTNRKVEIYVDMNASADNLNIRLYDIANASVIGSASGISASGLQQMTFTDPGTDTALSLECQKATDASTDPIAYGGFMEIEH